ncbi:NAD-dependent protein deacetylase sirtuin-6 [Symbiodinium microadriaticum]|uniref:NAD-dependent protein deacetylase sirtuin-6 n=1 Tax=Symbiodinium microadriaticum TaxID=2951 RepID=A0A1Q9EK37_SYMMI|nr:NAD-dependent protein deacetylase sirtuin-6 [Symbiodinium microadriaticum]
MGNALAKLSPCSSASDADYAKFLGKLLKEKLPQGFTTSWHALALARCRRHSWLTSESFSELTPVQPGLRRAAARLHPQLRGVRKEFQPLSRLPGKVAAVGAAGMVTRGLPSKASDRKRQRELSWECSCRDCRLGGIEGGAARVEVALALGAGRANEDGCDGGIRWRYGEPMAFHRTCWEQLLANRRSLAKSDLQLLQTAASTAEHFDAASDAGNTTWSAKLVRPRTYCAKAREQSASRERGFLQLPDWVIIGASRASGPSKPKGWVVFVGVGADLAYTTVYEELRPTFAHEALAKLVEMGKIAYVVSQNADGLHHLSGIPYSKLSDVHGSAFTEYCPSCRKRYVRNWYVPEDRAEDYLAGLLPGPIPPHIRRCPGCGSNHWTGRSCDDCGGPLHDTVISFGDGLEECVLRPAFEHAAEADACLSLGSTMSIGPSNQVVAIQKGPLIVCVRQDTEMDTLCQASGGVRVHGDCDEFMHHVMLALLGEEQFKDWEASLSEKRALYNSQRPSVGKQRGDIFVKKV